MSLAFAIASLTIYVLTVFVSIYFCVFADPDTSAVAAFFTRTLPTRSWQGLERCVSGTRFGRNALAVVEFFFDRSLMLVYIAIILGAWSVAFIHIYPWIDRRSEYLGTHHKYIGYLIFFSCGISWRLASRTSPGLITAQTLHRYNHFPYDHIMFVPNQTCPTKLIPRLARSKFDRYKYQEHVPRFDHYCGWVYNAIGEENYRFFLLFLLVHVAMCAYGSLAIGRLFYGEVHHEKLNQVTFFDRFTGQEIASSTYIVMQYLFHKFLLEAAVWLVATVMWIALTLFLGYHVWLTSRGLTTNESFKWDQVKRWYKRELQDYNESVRHGLVPTEPTGTASADFDETDKSDNSATPATTMQTTAQRADVPLTDNETPMHPGPPPINIYNRGVLENWKEVIFPLSLRNRRPPISIHVKTKKS